MNRRGLLRVATLGAVGVLVGRPALATLSRAVKVEDLVRRSRHVIVAEPLDNYSVWERIGHSKHIVTYTRVKAHDSLAGSAPEDELLIRTLGGRVGDLGEVVDGEARLTLGVRGVLFVTVMREALAVTAMAQGHYPLNRPDGIERLRRSPASLDLIDEQGAAVERLPGLKIDEARSLLRQVVQK